MAPKPSDIETDLLTPLTPELIKSFADAMASDIEVVRKLLDKHSSLARATINGQSMLHHAAGEGRVAAIRLLTERGADPNANWVGYRHTPLSWAVMNDLPEACRTLIECGAKVDLFCAAGMGRLEEVQSFFDSGGQVRLDASFTGSTRRNADGTVLAFSLDPIYMISDALYAACRAGRVEVAIYLLERGGNPAFRAFMSATCFHWAYFGGGNRRLIDAMIAHRADPQWQAGARQYTPRAFGILTAANWGWKYYLNRILETDFSLINFAEFGTTPLHEVVRSGKPDVVKWMLEFGADISAKDQQGMTPVELAVFLNISSVEGVLRDHGR